jgi:drug/metabolite transporter (DMT)-like permease
MFINHSGEAAALITSFCWTITALSFEAATKKVGSLAVNLIRLVLALLFLSIFCYFRRGIVFPVDANFQNWIWLSLSGIVGLTLGDFFLFKAYAMITSRKSQLVMTMVPIITIILGWTLMNEKLSLMNFIGISVTMCGILVTLVKRNINELDHERKHRIKGIFYAFLGAVGQALGLILSKRGMGNYDAFASTEIRLILGLIGYIVLITSLNKWSNITNALKIKSALTSITIGSIFGPFLGISFSLIAIQNTSTGIASTIMAIVPILIIIPSVFIYKQKITLREIIGAFISVGGVALLFLK